MGKRPELIGGLDVDWKAPDGSDWIVSVDFAEFDGRAECVSVRLSSLRVLERDEAHGIKRKRKIRPLTSAIWRAFPMSVIEDARLEMATAPSRTTAYSGPTIRGLLDQIAAPYKAPRPRALTGKDGKPLSAADALAEVAAVYAEAWRSGRSDPTVAVAEAFTLSRSAAAKRVARARDAGLLPRTKRGRPRANGKQRKGRT